MDKKTYTLLENYMISTTADSAHDREHVYRVLHNALAIAETEENVDYDILIAACLLHDVGRPDQFADPKLCHAQVGSEKAYGFLLENGFSEAFADKVRSAILTHRFRISRQPESLEAKILFDADKLDVTGAMGVARTLLYKGTMTEPLYSRDENGLLCTGEEDEAPSFFREYHLKLKNLYDRFYTEGGRAMAQSRRQIAADFYHALYQEVDAADRAGRQVLAQYIDQ